MADLKHGCYWCLKELKEGDKIGITADKRAICMECHNDGYLFKLEVDGSYCNVISNPRIFASETIRRILGCEIYG